MNKFLGYVIAALVVIFMILALVAGIIFFSGVLAG